MTAKKKDEPEFNHHELTQQPEDGPSFPQPEQPADFIDTENYVLPKDEITEDLESIYDMSGESQEDMTRLDRGIGLRWKRFLIGMVVFFGFLAMVSWAGFFIFSPTGNKFTGDGVKLEISGPPQINSGEMVKYEITVKNGESIPLGTANLNIRLPKEFTLKEILPKPEDDGLSWQIGSLSPNQEKSFEVSGIFLAPVDAQLDIQAILNYRPADFNSQFQKVTTRIVGVNDSIFGLDVFGPDRVMPGDNVDLDIAYLNTTDNEFTDLRLKVTWPEGFIPEKSEPEAVGQEISEWEIKILPANAEGRIKVSGSFASDAKGTAVFMAQLGLTDDRGDFGKQKEASYELDVIEGQLVISLILNGKDSDQPISFGDLLHYSLSWQNTGGSMLDDVTVSAIIETDPESQLVNWNELEDAREGDWKNGKLSWGSKQINALKNISPGEEGTIDFTLPVIDEPIAGTNNTNYRIVAKAEANIGSIDGQEVNRTVATPPITATVSSDTKLSAEARWFDDDGIPVGTGPLPPEVGEITTYRINWMVSNSLHDLSDLKVSARLPDNVIWTGKSSVDAGDIRFDAAENRIIWTLNWMPTDINELKVSFDLAITPTSSQQGKSPTLIDATILEARDRVNNNPIILSAPPMTTSLPEDQFAGGKGKVE